MTLTRPQRAALKLAMEALRREIRLCAFDANVAMNDPNAPPQMKKQLEKHKELAQALQVIEEMLRGVQTEMPL